MRIAVIDGQGGGLGKSLTEKLAAALGKRHEILALGTNALATAAMLRAGAAEGATGENAVAVNAARADIIVGAIGILSANSMLGELTPVMAAAIAESRAAKVLIPLNRCGITIAGVTEKPVAALVDDAVAIVKAMAESKE